MEPIDGDTIRVVVVEDHDIVVEGLRTIMAETDDLIVVGETDSVPDARALIDDLRPDVVLVDVSLQDRAGLEVCLYARETHPEVSCIALTSSFDDDLVRDTIQAGAAGYLLTRACCADLVDAVRHVASGGAVLDPSLTRHLFDLLQDRPSVPPAVEQLSPRRRRLLSLLAADLTATQIAEAEFVSEKTVNNQLSLLVRQLGLTNREDLTALAKALHRPTLRWTALL